MANTVLTADIIAREAVMILENNVVAGSLVYRGYEDEFDKNINGYKIGSTVRIRRPTDFRVRTTITAQTTTTMGDNVQEGSVLFAVDKVAGVDFSFASTDLTLSIGELSERVIKPALVQVGNQIDRDVLALQKQVPHWVNSTPSNSFITGTTTTAMSSFAAFAKATERLDLAAAPQDQRAAILSPTDTWGMLGTQTTLFMQDVAKGAYREGRLGKIANVDTYSSQNVQTQATGTRPNTASVAGTVTSTTWALTKTTGTMSFVITAANTSTIINEGEVFTIGGVFAVNPVTKATQNYLQPFVVRDAGSVTASAGGVATLTISPPIISDPLSAFQTVSTSSVAGASITFQGGPSGNFSQSMVFHRNAFGLVVVPMEMPPGSIGGSRSSYKGYSVRVVPYYDGANDVSRWRLDVLYGVRAIDPRIAVRVNG
jgi:hypothetical protein